MCNGSGKAGTLALMFALPGFLLVDALDRRRSAAIALLLGTWIFTIGGLVLSYWAGGAVHPAGAAGARGGPRARAAPNAKAEVARVKAVIMAGGEGTRLRPLTSNQPKPMMPLVNRPMMEHIVRLLAQHGFDDIVVTVAYLANQIRNYFGDGSDFGVRLRYATDETPLGTAGSVRNASDELDDTFLVISGDVLTDIDLSAFVKAHRAAGAFASIALKRVDNPLEFGIVITRPDGSVERFLEKPTWGQVFSDTINTGIYVLEPGDLRLHPRGRGRRLLRRRVPGRPAEGPAAARPRRRRATGRTSARSRRTCAPTRTCSTSGSTSRSTGSGWGRASGWARAPTSIPTPGSTGPVVIGDNCRIEAGAHLSAYTVLGTDVVVKPDAFLERSRVPRPRLRRAEHPAARVRHRPLDRPPWPRPRRGRRRWSATSASSARARSINPGVKIYPFKTVEAGRGRQLVDRVGEPRRPHALRTAGRRAASPTST